MSDILIYMCVSCHSLRDILMYCVSYYVRCDILIYCLLVVML